MKSIECDNLRKAVAIARKINKVAADTCVVMYDTLHGYAVVDRFEFQTNTDGRVYWVERDKRGYRVHRNYNSNSYFISYKDPEADGSVDLARNESLSVVESCLETLTNDHLDQLLGLDDEE